VQRAETPKIAIDSPLAAFARHSRHVNHLRNPNTDCMRLNMKCSVLLFILVGAALGIGGCADYYAATPGYGPYHGPGPYYGGGGPYYAGAGAVTVEVGDRPYYVRGPGYYVGRTYYVWRPGHWRWRNGQKVWIHGHYVVRGY